MTENCFIIKGGFCLHCLKCGKEIPEKQVFCETCLDVMEQFPVKPETKIFLPKRDAPSVSKKAPVRKKVLSPEERVPKLKKAVLVLSVMLTVAVLFLVLAFALLFDTLSTKDVPQDTIGQNYGTIEHSEKDK